MFSPFPKRLTPIPLSKRFFSTTIANLHHQFVRSSNDSPYNLIVLHGLMGSSNNFRSITSNPKIKTKVNSYLLDLRNHGSSEHKPSMEIKEMAHDVANFISQKQLNNIIIMGHSLGGKVLMSLATSFPEIYGILKGIMILDIAPVSYSQDPTKKYPHIEENYKMLKGLNEVDLKNKKYNELRNEIIKKCRSKDIGELIWTNVVHEGDVHKWRINLPSIVQNFHKIVDFVPKNTGNVYNGMIKVMRGSKSEYVAEHHIDKFIEVFPTLNREKDFIVIKDAGHWIHFEKPYDFINEVGAAIELIQSQNR